MYITRDKSGTVLLSENKPKRLTSYWLSPDSNYFVMNSKFGDKLFPNVTWQDEPIELVIILDKHIL